MIFNKQGSLIKKFKFYFQNREIETTDQYTYLGFIFVPSGKKKVGIWNLLQKSKKAWFAIQKMLFKSKGKTVNSYIKLIDSIIKPITLYACESWGDSLKKGFFNDEIEKFHLSMCRQVLGVKRNTNSMKVLAELGRVPFKVEVETAMFKYLERYPFIGKDRLLYKAFAEEIKICETGGQSWISNIKEKLAKLGLSNLFINLSKVTTEEIEPKNYKQKHKFFRKRAIDIFIQQEFHSYLNKRKLLEKGIFEISKTLYEKEKYLSLSNCENRMALSKLRLSSHNLAIRQGKWYNIAEEKRFCYYCKDPKIETEIRFLFECPRYKKLRQEMSSAIKDFTFENKNETLALFFKDGSLKAMNEVGKFVRKAFELREQDSKPSAVT